MSDARRRVAWDEMFDLALDPAKARSFFESAPPSTEGTCTMCGEMCAMRTVNQIMDGLTVAGQASGPSGDRSRPHCVVNPQDYRKEHMTPLPEERS